MRFTTKGTGAMRGFIHNRFYEAGRTDGEWARYGLKVWLIWAGMALLLGAFFGCAPMGMQRETYVYHAVIEAPADTVFSAVIGHFKNIGGIIEVADRESGVLRAVITEQVSAEEAVIGALLIGPGKTTLERRATCQITIEGRWVDKCDVGICLISSSIDGFGRPQGSYYCNESELFWRLADYLDRECDRRIGRDESSVWSDSLEFKTERATALPDSSRPVIQCPECLSLNVVRLRWGVYRCGSCGWRWGK